MKRIATMALATLFTLTSMSQQETITLHLVETSDVHGNFFPVNMLSGHQTRGSMARVASYVGNLRQKYGDDVILLDNGDILQGQPLNYYYNFVDTLSANIAAQVVNYLGYDAQTIGNHDVETGQRVYDKWITETRCPLLGANVVDVQTGKPRLQPYTIIERRGLRVAIIGLLTPAIPNWLEPELWPGLRFENMVESARKWVKVVREQEKADLVVGLFHSGWDGGIVTPDYREDDTKRVAELVDGFDVIFFGHDHTNTFVGRTEDGIILGYNGGFGFDTYGDEGERYARIYDFNENDVTAYTQKTLCYSEEVKERKYTSAH